MPLGIHSEDSTPDGVSPPPPPPPPQPCHRHPVPSAAHSAQSTEPVPNHDVSNAAAVANYKVPEVVGDELVLVWKPMPIDVTVVSAPPLPPMPAPSQLPPTKEMLQADLNLSPVWESAPESVQWGHEEQDSTSHHHISRQQQEEEHPSISADGTPLTLYRILL